MVTKRQKNLDNKSDAWRGKAHRIIGELAMASFLKANTTKAGTRRKKHVPYSICETGKALSECLGNHDQKEGEKRAKAIFLELSYLETTKGKNL